MGLTDVSIERSDVRLGTKLNSLPVSISEQDYVARNATSQEQTRSFKINITVVDRESYTFARALVSRQTNSTTMGFNIYGVSASTTGGTERSLTLNCTTVNEITNTRNYSEEFEQRVRPNTVMIIKVRRLSTNDVYSILGSLTIDGTVTVTTRHGDWYGCGPFNTDRCHRWRTRHTPYRLSSLLSAEQRTFDMGGRVTMSSSENTSTEISYAEFPIGQVPELAGKDDGMALDGGAVEITPSEVPAGAVFRANVPRTCGFLFFKWDC